MVCAELSQPPNHGVVVQVLGHYAHRSHSLSSIHDVAYDAESIFVSIELILMHYGPMVDIKGLSCSYLITIIGYSHPSSIKTEGTQIHTTLAQSQLTYLHPTTTSNSQPIYTHRAN